MCLIDNATWTRGYTPFWGQGDLQDHDVVLPYSTIAKFHDCQHLCVHTLVENYAQKSATEIGSGSFDQHVQHLLNDYKFFIFIL
jgi:hypothetical protein